MHLRCAESKSTACQAQKWPLSPQLGQFEDGGHHYAFCYFLLFLGIYTWGIPLNISCVFKREETVHISYIL